MATKDFITYTPENGNKNGSINVTAKSNNTSDNRSTNLKIQGNQIVKTINISQNGIPIYNYSLRFPNGSAGSSLKGILASGLGRTAGSVDNQETTINAIWEGNINNAQGFAIVTQDSNLFGMDSLPELYSITAQNTNTNCLFKKGLQMKLVAQGTTYTWICPYNLFLTGFMSGSLTSYESLLSTVNSGLKPTNLQILFKNTKATQQHLIIVP